MILAQMFFAARVGTRNYGWTEGHIAIQANTLTDALTQVQALAIKRGALLGAGVTIPYLRVSAREEFRDSQVAPGPQPAYIFTGVGVLQLWNPTTGLSGDPLYSDRVFNAAPIVERPEVRCDFPYAGLLVRMEGGTTFKQRSSLIIRGNPDLVQYTNYDRPRSAANPASLVWNTEATTYITDLLNGKWGFRTLDVAQAKKAVTGFAYAAGRITFTSTAHGYSVGDEVRVRSMVITQPSTAISTKVLNGIWTITAVTTDTFQVAGLFPDVSGFVVTKPGEVQKRVFVQLAYNKEVDRRWAERKTGVPFDQPRGRARKTA